MRKYVKADGNEIVNNLLSLAHGMWFEPMDKFSQVIYNADEIIPLIDFDQCVEFGTLNGQELLIYDMHGDRKHIRYSCSMTTMFDEIVLTDVWDENGQVYACDYDAIWDELAEKNNWNGELDMGVEATTIRASYRDTTIDEDAVRELVLVITNDGDQYRQQITPAIDNLKRKAKKGTYDRDLAVKLWQYVADEGVRRYNKKYGSGTYSVAWLNPATRRAIAEELRDYYEEEVMWDINHGDVNSATHGGRGMRIYANSTGVTTYDLIDYFDVWGNEEDGWEVNNLSREENFINITDDATDEDIIDGLINAGYLQRQAKGKISVEDYGDGFIELFVTETGEPVCRLEESRGVTSSTRVKKNKITAARVPKTIKELVLQGNYGYGWDDLTYYDDTPEGRKMMKDDYKAYQENEHIPLRTITRKSPNPDYVEPENDITVDEAGVWLDNSPYELEKQWSSDWKTTNLIVKQNANAFGKVQVFLRRGDTEAEDTVEVRNINTNRTKRVYTIDEFAKAVDKIMRSR